MLLPARSGYSAPTLIKSDFNPNLSQATARCASIIHTPPLQWVTFMLFPARSGHPLSSYVESIRLFSQSLTINCLIRLYTPRLPHTLLLQVQPRTPRPNLGMICSCP